MNRFDFPECANLSQYYADAMSCSWAQCYIKVPLELNAEKSGDNIFITYPAGGFAILLCMTWIQFWNHMLCICTHVGVHAFKIPYVRAHFYLAHFHAMLTLLLAYQLGITILILVIIPRIDPYE